jgi:hypothetical protein
MAFTYVISTQIGQVRFLIDDTVDSGHKFEDEEIQFFLDLYNGSIFYAGAACLEKTRHASFASHVADSQDRRLPVRCLDRSPAVPRHGASAYATWKTNTRRLQSPRRTSRASTS